MISFLSIFSSAFKWIIDPKNRKTLMFIGVIILILLLLQQCNANRGLKDEIENIENESIRKINNEAALRDTLENYKNKNGTLIGEKQGLLLTEEEAKKEYANLLGQFTKLKKEKVKTVIKTEYEIVERIDSIPVYITELDSNGNAKLTFSDTTEFDSVNYRQFSATIPVKLIKLDTNKWKLNPGKASLDFKLGMGLKTGLYYNEETKAVMIRAETDYPGVTFTNVEGANIMDDKDSKKITRKFRKQWSVGFQVGYGYTISGGGVYLGPQAGVGLNWSPKFLQWGK